MTQSGQGEEPSARPAHEGIVLPSDGGEPLLPGMTGGYGGQQGDPPAAQPPAQQPPASAPTGGQAWGTPWGPDQHGTPAPPPGQGWTPEPWGSPDPEPAATWGSPDPSAGTPSQPMPAEGTSSYGADAYGAPGAGGTYPPAGHGEQPAGPYGSRSAQAPGGYGESAAPLPPAGQYGSPPAGAQGGYGEPAAPLPPAGSYGSSGAGAALPPAGYGTPNHALPATDDGATQYIPPVAPGSAGDAAGRYPGSAAVDEGATQYIPPVTPGALPPEQPAGPAAEATQFLGRAPHMSPQSGAGPQPGAGPMPPAGAQPSAGPMPGAQPSAGPLPPASGPDAEATQYIPPVPGGPYGVRPGGGEDRQPPAEFDNLFRSEPGAESPAAATQQMPRFTRPGAVPPAAQPPYGPQGGGHGAYDDGAGGGRGGRGGRTGSRVPVIAAVGVGIAVLGIGAGALLSGGGGDDKGDKNQTVSATAPAEGSASPSADPAEQQAVALDKLLADSGSSRTSVINAVAHVKSCTDLGQAAKDLRAAAKQRGDLVTRLSALQTDKLPDHDALTASLTKAWQASAAADNHYAAWADQMGGKKACRKGQARTTPQTAAGNRASGTASTEKTTAAQLWNTIAKTYGLTQRRPTQL